MNHFLINPNKRQEEDEKLVEMSINDDCTTGNLIDFSYHQNKYKPIGTDFSRQAITSISQKINFTGKLEENDGVKMFFIAKKRQKIVLNLTLDSLIGTKQFGQWNIKNY